MIGPGSHLRTILWLRWRLSSNQWARAGTFQKVVQIILLVAGVVLAVAGGVGGFAAGLFGLTRSPDWLHLVIWDSMVLLFLFFWAIGLLAEVQRSESINLHRLMHLPISLRQVFVVNYIISHVSPILIITLPGMLGLALGLILGRGPEFLLLPFLILAYIFMITAWTYCLRGWLAGLMVNKRRRQAIIVAFTLIIILLAQLPNLYFNVWSRKNPVQRPPLLQETNSVKLLEGYQERNQHPKWLVEDERVRAVHYAVPFLWLPSGALGLMQGNLWPASLGILGAAGLGALGLGRAYRATLNFYKGATSSRRSRRRKERPPKAPPKAGGASRRFLVAWRLPGIPDQVTALGLATFRSLLRAPEAKMVLILPFIMLIVFGSMLFREQKLPSQYVMPFMGPMLIFFVLLGIVQLALNHFGFDRTGFRALVLMPVPRRYILVGKNVAMLCLSFILYLVVTAVLIASGNVTWDLLLAGFVQFLSGFLLLSMVGNLASILFPFRMAVGSLKKSKNAANMTVTMFLLHLLHPLAMLPMVIPPVIQVLFHALGAWRHIPISLLGSLVLLLVCVLAYRATLKPLERLLVQREKRILDVVTRDVE